VILRKRIKKLVSQWLGYYPYFGEKIYYPPGSVIVNAACEEGIYESANLYIINDLVRPRSWYFDVGANIGLLSLPILKMNKEVSVLSFEPSPNTVSYLRKTIASSGFSERWHLREVALGSKVGEVDFYVAAQGNDAFDGLQNTNRTAGMTKASVKLSMLDAEWIALKKPPVSMVKIDVEGKESEVLQGADELVSHSKPSILLECSKKNVSDELDLAKWVITYAREKKYEIFSGPNWNSISTLTAFRVAMASTESFLLVSQDLENFPKS